MEVKKDSIEHIFHQEKLLAIILRNDYHHGSIQFFTPGDFPLQLGYMNRPQGYNIQPHIHQQVAREVRDTQEVLFVKSGRVQIDFFSSEKKYLESRELKIGDVILLSSHGHGFTMLEPSVMIEVKTGPYLGERDKIRFDRKE